jgi:copper chaperone NosL
MEMFSLLLKPEQARKVKAIYVQDMDKTDLGRPKGRLDRRQSRLLRGRLEKARRHGARPSLLRHPRRCAEIRRGRRAARSYPFAEITADMARLDGGALHDQRM